MKMLRLPRSKVQLGARLPWNVRDDAGQLLLSRGHIVESEHQLDQLLERGAFVDAEEVKAVASQASSNVDPTVARHLNLFGLWDQATLDLQKLLTGATLADDLADQIARFAGHIIELVDSNADIGIYRCVRQEQAKVFYYGYAHSIHAAMLCLLLTRHLGWPAERVLTLVKAALTMNTSILALQGQMAGQDFPMRDKQRELIHEHPQRSHDLLFQAGVSDPEWLNAILQHHERPDGTGYPTGRTDLDEMAMLLRLTDVFLAKISPRELRPALTTQDAIRQVFRDDHGGALSTAVIKQFGIYPPGDFVKLASGELAVVVQRTANARAPIVAVITDKAEHPIAKTMRRDSSLPEYAITANAHNKTMLARLPPERLYGFAEMTHTATPPR
ncbi:HD-GYP domain-containing protein [Rhodoferax sp.]|uniref:HD-GYP domain-containing protein n=1 Tax=Rhodoferax sp. TaxID=50421 RepID=UPI00276F1B88|nr:HD domain-containing phosphohydrolase [Rhodoferax sp.]